MIGIEFVECFHCGDEYKNGTGHRMLCPDCEIVRHCCNDCYQHLKKEGIIKDTNYSKTDIHKKIQDKLR